MQGEIEPIQIEQQEGRIMEDRGGGGDDNWTHSYDNLLWDIYI